MSQELVLKYCLCRDRSRWLTCRLHEGLQSFGCLVGRLEPSTFAFGNISNGRQKSAAEVLERACRRANVLHSQSFAKEKSLRLQFQRAWRAARTRIRVYWSYFLEDGNSGDVEVDVLETMLPRWALGITLDASTLHGPCCAQPSPSPISKDSHAHLDNSQHNSFTVTWGTNFLGRTCPWHP